MNKIKSFFKLTFLWLTVLLFVLYLYIGKKLRLVNYSVGALSVEIPCPDRHPAGAFLFPREEDHEQAGS